MAVYVLTIAGVPQSIQQGWSIREVTNGINKLTCEVFSRDGTYRPETGDEIILTEDGEIIFGGTVDVPGESAPHGGIGGAGIVTRISAVDFGELAYRRVINVTMPAGTAVAITSSSVANPTVVTTATAHGRATGDAVTLADHQGSVPTINGPRVITVLSPTTFSVPINVTTGGTGGFLEYGNVRAALAKLTPYLPGVSLAQDFQGSQVQFLIQQAEYYRYLPEGDARLLTFFSGTTLTHYATEMASVEASLVAILDGMSDDERGALVAGADQVMWTAAQGFSGTEGRWFVQQSEYYRYLPEGDPRLQTWLNGTTVTAYAAFYTAHLATGLASIISAMPSDELAAFNAGYAVAVEAGFSGTTAQFLLQQGDYYRWMDAGDARLLTFFYAATLTAFETLLTGVEIYLASIISAMSDSERFALDVGYANALTPVAEGTFIGTLVQLFIQQAEFYRWLPEGDARLVTFFSGTTITAYNTAMEGSVEDGFVDHVLVPMAVDEAAAFAAGYAEAEAQGQIGGATLPSLSFPFQPARDALTQIATIANKPWQIDYHKILRLVTPGDTAAPFNLTTANKKALGDVTVEPSQAEYANRILILGGSGQQTVTDTFTGDGVTTSFVLDYTLVSHLAYVAIGVIPEGLTAAGGGGTWTYTTVAGTTTITRTSAPANLAAISIIYTAQLPVLVWADDLVEQAKGRGIVEKIYKSDSFDVDVLQALADAYLARQILEPRTVRYRTRETGIHPGQTQTITLPGRDLSGTWLITDVQIVHVGGNIVERLVTALEGDLYTGSWRDDLEQWSSGGGSSSATDIGSVTIVSGGGVGGVGTVGKLPKWATSTTLTDSIISESGSVATVAGTMAATLFSGSGASLTSLPAGQLTGTITSSVQDNITRVGTLVSGATGAGFTIALSTSTVTGNLAYARMPSGSGTWTAVPTISGILTLSSDLTVAGNAGTTTFASQTTGWRITAAGEADFRYLFTDELFAKSFIADLEQALAGGQIICKSVTQIGAAFTVPAASGTATLTVKDLPSAANMAVFVSGDTVVVRSFSRANGGLIIGDAIGVVTSYADAANGLQTWTFTRNNTANGGSLASSTVIAVDAIVLDYGTSGSGYYEVSAIDGTVNVTSITRSSTTATVTTSYAHGYKTGDTIIVSGAVQTAYNGAQTITVTGTTTFTFTVAGSPTTPATGTILLNDANGTNAPYAQIVTWATSPIGANKTVRTRFGNLRGITGTNGEYGMIAGTYASSNGTFFRASNSAFELHGIDLYLWDGSTNTVKIDHATPSIALGTPVPTAYGAGTGIWMGKDTDYKFRVGVPAGNRLAWDGTNLTLVSEKLTIDNNGVSIATPGISYASTYGYKFATSFSGVEWMGTFAQEPDASTRALEFINSTNSASKLNQIVILAQSATKQAQATFSASTTGAIDFIADTMSTTCPVTINSLSDGLIILNYLGGAGANSALAFYRSSSLQGSITTSGGVTAYNTTSDERLKSDVVPTKYGLADLLQIQVSDYTMVADNAKTKRTGFIAQQLHGVFPAPVTAPLAPSDPWQMDYCKLTPLLVVSIQQLAVRVAALEKS